MFSAARSEPVPEEKNMPDVRRDQLQSVPHGFVQAYSLVKFGHGSLILGSSHFLLLPQKMILDSKEVKKDSKIIILLR